MNKTIKRKILDHLSAALCIMTRESGNLGPTKILGGPYGSCPIEIPLIFIVPHKGY